MSCGVVALIVHQLPAFCYNPTMTIAILGRQPKLGLAELESLLGSANVKPFGASAALLDTTPDPTRLGGSMRLAERLAQLPVANWAQIEPHIAGHVTTYLQQHAANGKITIGISVFGAKVTGRQLFATGLVLKKSLRSEGHSVRIVPSNSAELNSAQVLRNQLTREPNIELLVVTDGHTTWLARTTWIQDIDAYAARDQARPRRDAFVGMLPPKLAQIMLNMAQVLPTQRVLDPFCGTGVVLQEAGLMGCRLYGTDLDQKMIDYTAENLAWLARQHTIATPTLEAGDATNHRWQQPVDCVVAEAYLGQPLSGLPKPQKVAEIQRDCNTITTKFLRNLHPQLKKGARLCIAVPAWRIGPAFVHLELLDHLSDLGYNRVRFQYAPWPELIYHREGQIVARELLILTVI